MTADAAPRGGPAIVFRSVGVDLGGRAILTDVTLEVPRGAFVCVIGPSGCGKTTLLRLLAGLLEASSGTVEVFGRPAGRPTRDVAVVFQDYGRALLPWRDATGNVALALEAAGMPRARQGPVIAALLEKVGLAAHAHKFPAQLSGGMQQRLQIARCLAQEPSVLLMDEPFGALDAMTRQQLQDEVTRLVAERSTTVFFVTHDLDEALYLGDRVVALLPDPGRLARVVEVPLARPRDQLATREDPVYLKLRRELFDLIHGAHA